MILNEEMYHINIIPYINLSSEADGLVVHQQVWYYIQLVVNRLQAKPVLQLRSQDVLILDVNPDLNLIETLLAVNTSVAEC